VEPRRGSVKEQEATGEWSAERWAHEEFKHLERLEAPHDARDDPKHATVGTTAGRPRFERSREHTAVARASAPTVIRRELPLALERARCHQRQTEQHRNVVENVPRRHVVAAVYNDVVPVRDRRGVLGADPSANRGDADLGVHLADPPGCRVGLGLPYPGSDVQHLSVEVAEFDSIVVHDRKLAHSTRGEVQRCWAPQPSGTHDQH
jgi:hypothetical protein